MAEAGIERGRPASPVDARPGRPSPRRVRRTDESERGAMMALLAISLFALMAVAALAVDVGVAYSQRRQNSSIADMVTLAAARHLPGDPPAACSAAWTYLKANLRALPTAASSPCSGFPSVCDSSTSAAAYQVLGASPYTIVLNYPVPDGDPLLGTARTQDGTNQCERIGMSITRVDGNFFARSFGGGALSPYAFAVARHSTGYQLETVANLVVLDPTGCTGIDVQGASGTAVVVGTSAHPGAIAVDSDGTACSGGQTTVKAANGTELWAQPTSRATPGEILLYSQPGSQTTCGAPACRPTDVGGGQLAPQPISEPARVTRSVVDYPYNCKANYPVLYDGVLQIPGCDNGTPPYIDSFVSAVTSFTSASLPTGYTKISGGGCSPSTSPPPGNYWVACTNFKVNSGTIAFTGGNVIFTGNISVSGGATLSFNTANANTYACATEPCLAASSAGASFVYVDGNVSATGASLTFKNTFVYITPGNGSANNFGCSTGGGPNYTSESGAGSAVTWIAPTEGPYKNLALWSEAASNKFQLTGGGAGSIDGVFFTPCANPFTIAGQFNNPQTAQFLSFQLAVTGGANLTMTPDPTRLLITAPSGSLLMR